MKKLTTLVAGVVALAVLVGIIVLLSYTRKPEKANLPELKIPAIATEEEAKEVEGETKPEKKGPADTIIIEREGTKLVLQKSDKDKWKIVEPARGYALTYKVRAMLRLFKDGLSCPSEFAQKVTDKTLADFGLDEASRVHVTLKKGDEVLVDLFIGDTTKSTGETGTDTLVMVPGRMVVYRIKDKDLRSPFDVDLEDIQDKALFDFTKDEIVKIEIHDPRSEKYPDIVLEKKVIEEEKGENEEKSEKKEEKEEKKKEKKTEWVLVKPEGFEVENIDSYARTIATARAEEYLSSLPGADRAALDKPFKITVTVKRKGQDKEEKYTLLLGAGRRKGVYAKVEGRKGYIIIGKYTANQLMKGLNDLRKKKLFNFKGKDIEEISLEYTDEGKKLVLKKENGEWKFVEPAGVPAADSKVRSLANSIANFRVAEYLAKQPTDEEAGLTKPFKVHVKLSQQAGGAEYTILIGKKFENKKKQERYYAKLEGGKEIFAIMRYVAKNLQKKVDDLKDKRVFRIKKDEIAEVTIQHPDQKLVFKKEKKDDSEVWNMTEPEKIEDVSFESVVSTLANLDVKKIVTDKKPEEVGLTKDAVTVKFKLKDGSEHEITFSEEVKDNANYAMTTTEPDYSGKILLINKYKVKNLLKKLPDFKKDKEE